MVVSSSALRACSTRACASSKAARAAASWVSDRWPRSFRRRAASSSRRRCSSACLAQLGGPVLFRQLGQHFALFDEVALIDQQLLDPAVGLSLHRDLAVGACAPLDAQRVGARLGGLGGHAHFRHLVQLGELCRFLADFRFGAAQVLPGGHPQHGHGRDRERDRDGSEAAEQLGEHGGVFGSLSGRYSAAWARGWASGRAGSASTAPASSVARLSRR